MANATSPKAVTLRPGNGQTITVERHPERDAARQAIGQRRSCEYIGTKESLVAWGIALEGEFPARAALLSGQRRAEPRQVPN